MNALLALPVVLPLFGAAVSILVGFSRTAQRVIGITVLTAVAGISIALLVDVDRNGPRATQGGGWDAPLGISLVADRFSALILVVSSLVLLAVLVYAIGQPGAERNHVGFQSVYLVLAAGVSGALLTADLFNLFVSIELMLTASYVLILLGGRLDQVRSGMTYIVISLLASTLFLVTLAFTYASTGSVNLAELSRLVPELSPAAQGALAACLLVVFGIKAALVPLHFWLPDSYPTAPAPVTAIFAGLLTKIGVYAIIRTQTLLFGPDALPSGFLMTVGIVTMVVGGICAIAQQDVKRILSFQIVSSIGSMVLGLALFTVAGIAGAIFYVVHNIVIKTTLFLTEGIIEHHTGSSRLSRLSAMIRTAPVTAVLFGLAALSLVGVPPFSGFGSKFALLMASAGVSYWPALAAVVVVGFLTLFSMAKVWIGVFWAPADADTTETEVRATPRLMLAPTAVLVAGSLALGVLAGPVLDLTSRAATDLLHPNAYVSTVIRR